MGAHFQIIFESSRVIRPIRWHIPTTWCRRILSGLVINSHVDIHLYFFMIPPFFLSSPHKYFIFLSTVDGIRKLYKSYNVTPELTRVDLVFLNPTSFTAYWTRMICSNVIISDPLCTSEFSWMQNSLGQEPCVIAGYLQSQCGNGCEWSTAYIFINCTHISMIIKMQPGT